MDKKENELEALLQVEGRGWRVELFADEKSILNVLIWILKMLSIYSRIMNRILGLVLRRKSMKSDM